MAYERITLEIAGGVATLTLNHPATRNALAWAMADEISHALDHLGDARALVIAAAGKSFCSGGDMGMSVPAGQTMGDEIKRGLSENVNPMLLKLRALDIPVIAAVNGAAAGAGAPLALSADLVIAGESAFFFMAFPNVGLVPDAGGTWLLPRLIGTPRAMQMMMLAEKVGAAQALDWGMIYKVVADDALLAEAQALAAKLAKGPTVSYGLIRRNIATALDGDYAAALALEAEGQRVAGGSADCAEAVSAFLEKRSPNFQGK